MRENPVSIIYIYIVYFISTHTHWKQSEQRRKEMNTVESSDRRHSLRILTDYCTRRPTPLHQCSIYNGTCTRSFFQHLAVSTYFDFEKEREENVKLYLNEINNITTVSVLSIKT